MSAGRHVVMLLENNPYGRDTRVRQEAEALAGAGYCVSVICPGAGRRLKHERLGRVDVYCFPAPPEGRCLRTYLGEYSYSVLAMGAISAYLWLRHGLDIVHVHNPPDLLGLVAAGYRLIGKRFVFDHHDLAPELYGARFCGQGNALVHRALLFFEKLCCRCATHVIAVNQSYRDLEMQRDGVPAERITIVRNGPDLDRWQAACPDEPRLAGADTVLGYVGVLGFQDGLDYLLRSLAYLVHDLGRTDVCCVIMGDGDALPSLKVLCRDLDLEGCVRFTGWLAHDEVVRHLAAIDIGLVPDPSNTYNDRSTMIKLMEYMALAKPVVAFDLPEHRFTAGDAAIYARPNDEQDLASKIVALMDDPDLCCRLGRVGRQRVETDLAWQHQRQKLLQVYSTLAQGRRVAAPGSPRHRSPLAALRHLVGHSREEHP